MSNPFDAVKFAPRTISVRKSCQYRAIQILATGQLCECWLPRGDYHDCGECTISGPWYEGQAPQQARKLERVEKGKSKGYWYVGMNIRFS